MNLPADASQDQNNCPLDYYRRNNGMLHQLPVNEVETRSNELTPAQFSALDAMSKDELIALVQRVSGAMWGYALQTKDEKREALRLKVYAIAMGSAQDAVTLKAANDWLDRDEGKATQRVQLQAQVVTFDAAKHQEEVTRKTEEMFMRLAGVTSPSIGEGK